MYIKIVSHVLKLVSHKQITCSSFRQIGFNANITKIYNQTPLIFLNTLHIYNFKHLVKNLSVSILTDNFFTKRYANYLQNK